MTLRGRVLLFLFIFALLPLLVAVAVNLPLVLDRVELFYRQAFLQNLRADFRDLDQHLASREEVVRLLAKLPEPGAIMGTEGQVSQEQIDLARIRYTEWINRIVSDQLDIIDILFIDDKGGAQFWLTRDPATHNWNPTTEAPSTPAAQTLSQALEANAQIVISTPVRLDTDADNPARAVTLQLITPIGPSDGGLPVGAVAITVDIGGLASRDPDTFWVRDNGEYLRIPGVTQHVSSSFEDFPGLEEKFTNGGIVLWEGRKNQQVIWVPLLKTDDHRPLWVGRWVNYQPLDELRTTLIVRVLSIILILVLAIWLVARRVAKRSEVFGQELLRGIRRMLEKDEAVTFSWSSPQELQQLGNDLSKLARTHASNARNLRAHARELEESNRYKSEFLANVSHELRTPLNSILLLSKMLAKEGSELSQESRKRAGVIYEASRDLRALIDNILDLSRIEAGQMVFHFEQVDLQQLLEDLQALMQPQFVAKSLNLELEIAADAPRNIITDSDKLRQILKNFLANAVKFTAAGSVQLKLASAVDPYSVSLSVADQGLGIAEDKQELIFEAFRQADGSTSRRYGGTGLGLSISRDLAKQLCGEIRLYSRLGEGSEFSLLLPAECTEAGCTEKERLISGECREVPEQLAVLQPEANFSGNKILLLEDNMRSLLRLTELLESWNVEVFAAGDEEEAIETLEDEPDISLVLAASRVPVTDGYARIKHIHEQATAGAVKVVVLVEPGQEPSLIQTADDKLTLPVDSKAMQQMLVRFLMQEQG